MDNKKRWHVLAQIIKENGFKACAEIGVKSGRNIYELCRMCPGTDWLAVDPWVRTENYKRWSKPQIARHEREFDEIHAMFPEKIKKVKAFSVDAAKNVPDGSLDLVFIDGDHRYEGCKSDIEAWLPKIRKGGVISGHDYHHPRFPDVTKAVDEAFGDVEERDDRVWIVR